MSRQRFFLSIPVLLPLSLILLSCSGGREGVDEAAIGFHATGNDPFWRVDIDFETGGVRVIAEGKDPYDLSSIIGSIAFETDLRRLIYILPLGEALVEINIDRKECKEGESREDQAYSVNLRFLDPRTREEKSSYDGCGRYNGLGELTRRWRLVELDGEEINEIREGERMPNVWFNLAEGTVSGDGSCNYFNGPATIVGDSIRVGQLAGSKAVCPRISRESLYIDALRNRSHSIELTDVSLVLKSDLHEMRFVRE
jgi:heat shock protein HslJ